VLKENYERILFMWQVLACTMLKLLPRYRDATIVRSRDPAVLAPCTIVVDVGGEFDPARHRYDHHQVHQYCGSGTLNPCCGSRMFIRDPNFFYPGSASKNLSILTQQIVSKLLRKKIPGCSSRIRIDFLPITDPGSRGSKRHRIPDPQH
jgi:hypothetical protein